MNILQQSFNFTNKYIILATPLILFSLLSSLYILFSINGNLISLLFAGVLFVLMLGAFMAGWFFMVREGIKDTFEENPNLLLREFPAGVGEFFLPVLGLIFTAFIISLILLIASYYAGMHFIGNIGIQAEDFSKAMESASALKAFLMSLSDEQLLKLNAWNLLLFGTMSVTYFLIMFYPPALFYKNKNPLKAYFYSFKDLFGRKFFKNIALFLALFVSYFILSILTAIFGMNIITHFIFTLINFYYLIFIAVLVFNYYYTNFVKTDIIV